MKLSKLFRIKDTMAYTLLTAAALLAASNAEAGNLLVSEVEYAGQLDSFTPLHLSCKAANNTQENLQTGISVSLVKPEAYGDQAVACTSVRNIELAPAGSTTVTFDEYLNWLINWPPEAGQYTLNITEEGTHDILYSGTVEFMSGSLTINVTEPGTLPQLIGADRKYHITSLTLSGELNGSDIRLLRDMAGSDIYGEPTQGVLSYLDMREARIVAGGDYYYYHNFFGYQTTMPGCLSHFMFHNCTSLHYLAMPADTEVIGQWALTGSSLERIGFSDCLKVIGSYAFVHTHLGNVQLPESLEAIDESAFAHCDQLTDVAIGASVCEMTAPFEQCPALRRITVSESNPYFCDIDGVLFSKDGSTLLAYPNAKGEEYTMPATTTRVDSKAFFGAKGIRKVTCSDSLDEIERYAFALSGIETIDFGSGLEIIRTFAFYECTSLAEITFPAGMQLIEEFAFRNCTNLSEATSLATVPPVCEDGVFGEINPESTLYVPAASIDSYRNAEGWKDFYQIKAGSAGVNGITAGDDVETVGIYSADGIRLSEPCRGINIYRMSDGTTRKVLNR